VLFTRSLSLPIFSFSSLFSCHKRRYSLAWQVVKKLVCNLDQFHINGFFAKGSARFGILRIAGLQCHCEAVFSVRVMINLVKAMLSTHGDGKSHTMDIQNKFLKSSIIKRTLTGGMLSAIIAGIAIAYMSYLAPMIPNQVLFFLCFLFIIPAYPLEIVFPALYSYPPNVYDALTYLTSLSFWFLAGCMIVYFTR